MTTYRSITGRFLSGPEPFWLAMLTLTIGYPLNGQGSTPDAAPEMPRLTSVQVDTKPIDVSSAPSAVALQFTFTASRGLAYADFTFVSPSGGTTAYVSYPSSSGPVSTGGTLAFETPLALNLYAKPGTWTLSEADIGDRAGHYVTYEASQFGKAANLQVVNHNTPDILPPAISDGKILTPTLSASDANPVFSASIHLSDDVSGVVLAFITVLSPSGLHAPGAYTYLGQPILSGKQTIYIPLGSNPEQGTWTIFGSGANDAAGHYHDIYDPSALTSIFGTTSFVVTK